MSLNRGANGYSTRATRAALDELERLFEKVRDQALREAEKGGKDRPNLLRDLDSKQRRVLPLFRKSREIAAKDIAARVDR
jgi:hypothetical protein